MPSFMMSLGESQETLALLLESLDEKGMNISERADVLKDVVDELFSKTNMSHIAAAEDLRSILNAFSAGSVISPSAIENIINTEMTRSSFLLNIANSLHLQLENLHSVMHDMVDHVEHGDSWPDISMHTLSRDINFMMQSVDSITKIVQTPSSRMHHTISQVESKIKPHVENILLKSKDQYMQESPEKRKRKKEVSKMTDGKTVKVLVDVTETTRTLSTISESAVHLTPRIAATNNTTDSGNNPASTPVAAPSQPVSHSPSHPVAVTSDEALVPLKPISSIRVFAKTESFCQTEHSGPLEPLPIKPSHTHERLDGNESVGSAIVFEQGSVSSLGSNDDISSLKIEGSKALRPYSTDKSKRGKSPLKSAEGKRSLRIQDSSDEGEDGRNTRNERFKKGPKAEAAVKLQELEDRETALNKRLLAIEAEVEAKVQQLLAEEVQKIKAALAMTYDNPAAKPAPLVVNMITPAIEAPVEIMAPVIPEESGLKVMGRSYKGKAQPASPVVSKSSKKSIVTHQATEVAPRNSDFVDLVVQTTMPRPNTADIGTTYDAPEVENAVVNSSEAPLQLDVNVESKNNVSDLPVPITSPVFTDNGSPGIATARSELASLASSINDTISEHQDKHNSETQQLLLLLAPNRKDKSTSTDELNVRKGNQPTFGVSPFTPGPQNKGVDEQKSLASFDNMDDFLDDDEYVNDITELAVVSQIGGMVTKTYRKMPKRKLKDEVANSRTPFLLLYNEYVDVLDDFHAAKLFNFMADQGTLESKKAIQKVFSLMYPVVDKVDTTITKGLKDMDGCEKMTMALISLANDGSKVPSTVYRKSLEQLYRKVGEIESMKLWVEIQLIEFRAIFTRINAPSITALPELLLESKPLSMSYQAVLAIQGKMVELGKRLDELRKYCQKYQLAGSASWPPYVAAVAVSENASSKLRPITANNSMIPPTSDVPTGVFQDDTEVTAKIIQYETTIESLQEELQLVNEEKEELNLEVFRVMQEGDRTPGALLFFAALHDPVTISVMQQLSLQLTQLKGFADCSTHVDYATLRKRLNVCINSLPTLDRFISKFIALHKKWSQRRLGIFMEKGLVGNAADSAHVCPMCDCDARKTDAHKASAATSQASGVVKKKEINEQRKKEREEAILKKKITQLIADERDQLLKQTFPVMNIKSIQNADLQSFMMKEGVNLMNHESISNAISEGTLDINTINALAMSHSTPTLPSLTRKKLVATIKLPNSNN